MYYFDACSVIKQFIFKNIIHFRDNSIKDLQIKAAENIVRKKKEK